MSSVEERLHTLGIALPEPFPPAGLYVAAVRAGVHPHAPGDRR